MVSRAPTIDYNRTWAPVIREAARVLDTNGRREVEGYITTGALNDPAIRNRIADLLDFVVMAEGGREALRAELQQIQQLKPELQQQIGQLTVAAEVAASETEKNAESFFAENEKGLDAIKVEHRGEMEGIIRELSKEEEGVARSDDAANADAIRASLLNQNSLSPNSTPNGVMDPSVQQPAPRKRDNSDEPQFSTAA